MSGMFPSLVHHPLIERTDEFATAGLFCTILRNIQILRSSVRNASLKMECCPKMFVTRELHFSDLVDGEYFSAPRSSDREIMR